MAFHFYRLETERIDSPRKGEEAVYGRAKLIHPSGYEDTFNTGNLELDVARKGPQDNAWELRLLAVATDLATANGDKFEGFTEASEYPSAWSVRKSWIIATSSKA